MPGTVKKKTQRKRAVKSVESKVNSVYQNLINRLEKIETFTLEQAPDVCKEIVEVEVVEAQNNMIREGFDVFTILPFFCAGLYLFDLATGLSGERMFFSVAGGVLLAGGGGIGIMCSFSGVLKNFLYMREIKAGPKLLILKTLKKMIK